MKHNTPSTCYRKVAVISATEVHDMLNNTWFESCSLYSFFRDNQVLCHINHGALTVLVSKLKAASDNIFPWIILETIQKCWLSHLPLTFQIEAEPLPFLLACTDQFCVIIIYFISHFFSVLVFANVLSVVRLFSTPCTKPFRATPSCPKR